MNSRRSVNSDVRHLLFQRNEAQMKRIILMLAFFSLTTAAAFPQAGYGGQENNLRGLKGVRLVVMFARAEAIEETERAGILKLVEADAIAKFQKAGIPLFHYANEIEDAGSPQLVVYITCDKPNGFVYPVVANVKLLQRVRLSRDWSIEGELVTWEHYGIGAPKLTVEMICKVAAGEIDQFIKDYTTVNVNGHSSLTTMPNKSLDASGGSVFRNLIGPAMLE